MKRQSLPKIHSVKPDGALQSATLTVRQAARLLGISVDTAYESIRRGQLPALHFGRRIVVSRVMVERLLSGREHPSGSADQ